MDLSSSIGRSGPTQKTINIIRFWIVKEEQVLVSALKDHIHRGCKCDNGFKTEYLGILDQTMLQAFPGIDLKSNPHINSKIHVWNKNYSSLSTMLSRLDFGWNDAAHTLDVQSDEVWDNYVKYKAWPYYNDWCDIFCKDRATGENAKAFADVMQDLFTGSKRKQPDKGFEEHVPPKIIGFEHDASASRKVVFDALCHMNFMSVEDKIYDLDLFVSLLNKMKGMMVKMMLNGRI
ncbi:hypothetical protein Pfo_018432 [Paulownia fortunei]|nr:hypothetical protein Pfo_018432 [Paulownia fortunei]